MCGEISLDPARLENVKHLDGGGIRAACPACRAAGSDKSGDHLLIQPGGKFGCAANPGDGEHRKEIFRLAGMTRLPSPATNGRNGSPAKSNPAFNWQACVDAFTDEHAQRLASWRGLSIEFVRWLHAQKVIGIFENKFALANHGDGGKVVSAHVRLESGNWIFKPTGQKTAPLVFCDKKAAGFILAFESQWDAFAVMDKRGWHTANGLPDAAVFITRGAGNGELIAGCLSPDAVCYAFKQNDQPTPKKPIPAGDGWLADIASHAGCKVLNVSTPPPHKDANDWTKAGATAAELEAAMKAATPVQPAKTAPVSTRADIAAEYLGDEAEPEQDDLPPMVDAAAFMDTPQEMPPELVAGVLHKGSKLALGGSSKAFKTWTLLDMAISVAHGQPWLGFDTQPGNVLFVNFEIQPYAWQRRIAAVTRAKNVELKPGAIRLLNLRGHAADFRSLIPKIIERCRAENFALIILDPIYKLYGGTDENAAGDVAALLNSLERLAVETGAAVAYGCHFAKGNAGQKETLDRISGSGVFARDPDALAIFTKHETEGAFTVEMVCRNFAPVDPFVVRWQFPLMQTDEALDPADLKQPAGRKREHDPVKLLAFIANNDAGNPISTSEWARLAEIPRKTLTDYLAEMRRKNWIETIGEGIRAKQAITNEGKAILTH